MSRRDPLQLQPHDAPLGFARLAGLAPIPLAAAVVLAVLSAALSLAPFYFLYRMALEIFALPPDVAAVQRHAASALWAMLARWLLMGLSHCLAHLGAFNVLYRLRLALAQQLGRVPMSFFARRRSGELRRTLLDDTGSLEGFLAHMLPDAVAALVVPLFALILLFALDWRLSLAALLPLPLAVLLQWLMLRDSAGRMREWQTLQGNIAAQLVEYLRGMPVVKVFGLSAASFGELAQAIHGAVQWVERYAGRSAASWAAFVALLAANLIVVAPVAAWLHSRGEIDIARVVLFLLLAPAVLQPLLRLTFAAGEQARRRAALARIDAILRAPVLAERADAAAPAATQLDVEFDQVDFNYDGSDGASPAALSQVSFRARAGQVTALVGASGAGKSTVLRLLARFHDCDAGAIRLGGVDLREWPLDALQARLGFVLQEVVLFHGSVRDNLLLARPQASEAELIAAASAARAHEFINRLPAGYDTGIGERGALLSGGERQRLSIARALLKDAPVLLLDEATAYADAENERLIQQALDTICRGRTVLLVAHRLHTVRHADHIVVFEQGRIAGQGRHAALLSACAAYRRLWRDHEQARDWQLGAVPAAAADSPTELSA